MKRSAVIDLDSIIYIVASNQFNKLGNRGDADKVKNNVRDFIESILNSVSADEYLMYYQNKGHRNFRLDVDKLYKANRPSSPEFITHWRTTITKTFDEMGAVPLQIIESDDAVSIINKTYDYINGELIMCHNDKDMYQLPGTHYRFTTKEFRIVTAEEAKLNLYIQLLTGDSTDNIMGCGKKVTRVRKATNEEYEARKGVGPKTAESLLKKSRDQFEGVLTEEYKKVFPDNWREEIFVTKQLITLLDPKQTLEDFNTEFNKNDKLFTTSSIFTAASGIDSLFN